MAELHCGKTQKMFMSRHKQSGCIAPSSKQVWLDNRCRASITAHVELCVDIVGLLTILKTLLNLII